MYSWAKCSLDPVKMNAGAGPNAHLSVFEFEFDFHAVSCCSMQQENLCSFSVSYHVFLFPFLNDTSWMDDRIGMMGSFQKMGTRQVCHLLNYEALSSHWFPHFSINGCIHLMIDYFSSFYFQPLEKESIIELTSMIFMLFHAVSCCFMLFHAVPCSM